MLSADLHAMYSGNQGLSVSEAAREPGPRCIRRSIGIGVLMFLKGHGKWGFQLSEEAWELGTCESVNMGFGARSVSEGACGLGPRCFKGSL